MACLKSFQINIIKGDSVQKNVVLVNINKDLIDSIYLSCNELGISKELTYNSETKKYEFYLSPQETAQFNVGQSDYDITIKFVDNNIKTVVYKSTIYVYPKTNVVEGINNE